MIGGDEGTKAPAAGAPQPLEWNFSQVFGERAAGEEVQEGSVFNPDFEFIDWIFVRAWLLWFLNVLLFCQVTDELSISLFCERDLCIQC
jgi:hypothetical protein